VPAPATDGPAQALDIFDITITDDDAPTPTTYSLTPASTTVVEDAMSVTFTVTRSSGLSGNHFASTVIGTAPALAGAYQGLLNQPITFAAASTLPHSR